MINKKSVLGFFAVMTVFGSSAPAFAQGYIGGSIGQSEVSIDDCDGTVTCDEKDTAWRILGGYQFNRNLALEVGYHQFGDASATGPGGRINFEGNAIELVAVGSLPLV